MNETAHLADAIRARTRGKVAIMGIGNILRGDDGLGPELIKILKERRLPAELFDCGTAPENYIFPILKTSCDTLIIVDAADLGKASGEVGVYGFDEVSTISFSTHNPSPRLFIDLIRTGNPNLHVFVVPIQPKQTVLGAALSDEIRASLACLADAFSQALTPA